MAENLSIPSDYAKSKGKGMDLLPPSAFESKTKQSDPWKEIAKATEEVLRLKMENAKLKEAQSAQVLSDEKVQKSIVDQPVRPFQDVCKYRTNKDDLRYVDELISKQASEITELKNELRAIKCKHKDELSDMERNLSLKERDFSHRMALQEEELKAAENRYDNQVDRLSREHQQETDELNDITERLQDELNTLRLRSGERLEQVEKKYEQLHAASTQKIEALSLELRSKETLVENQAKQIRQLKKYLGETENLPKPVEIAKKERESLAAKVKVYEAERESLTSTIQLLNIRLNSMSEILRLQEKDFSQLSNDGVNTKVESLLLTRWREKVFALMVQQKSSAIMCLKDEANWKAKVSGLEKRLTSAQSQVDQLAHSLSDMEAQLTMEKNQVQKLESELREAQQLALCLDDRIQENIHHSQQLQQLAASVWSKYESSTDQLNSALSTIKAYGQRISFASGRIEMLQGLFARREAMLKLQFEGSLPERETTLQTKAESGGDDDPYLRSELEKVIRERDNLAAQIRHDAQLWDDKLANVRKQVNDEMDMLKQAKEDLEVLVQEKMHACSELSEKLEDCERDLEFSQQTVDELKDTLARQDLQREQLVAEQRREIDQEFADTLAEKDRQLNDAKREHAKAVVSLRQLERQTARDKERSVEHLATVEEHYTRQLAGLTEQLHVLEKERNLMMATLRQEGLIGKLKSERGEPLRRSWDTEREPDLDPALQPREPGEQRLQQTSLTQDMQNNQESENQNGEDEPLTAVLEDLQSLTTAVLADDNSDINSDEGS